MKLVNHWGEIWKMSDSAYRRYIRAGVQATADVPEEQRGPAPMPADFGAKLIGTLAFSSADAGPADFEMAATALAEG